MEIRKRLRLRHLKRPVSLIPFYLTRQPNLRNIPPLSGGPSFKICFHGFGIPLTQAHYDQHRLRSSKYHFLLPYRKLIRTRYFICACTKMLNVYLGQLHITYKMKGLLIFSSRLFFYVMCQDMMFPFII